MNKLLLVLLFLAVTLVSKAQKSDERFASEFADQVYSLTEVMFHDVINPPAAARFYSYSMLAADYVLHESSMPSLQLELMIKDYPQQRIKKDKIHPQFSAIYAMLETGKGIIPSGLALQKSQDDLYRKYLRSGIKKQLLDSSVSFAVEVAKIFLQLSKGDGYLKLSTLRRYEPALTDSTWHPTPPEYMAAVESNWKTIRTFLIDSCDQFTPKPPAKFSSRRDSYFYSLMEEVYRTSTSLTDEQSLIARYWDCNPFANFYVGHVSIGIKKISPGGHWMNITGIACKKSKASFSKTVMAHTLVALGLHDGFVSCWDEKYRSDRIRPKTAINRYIDDRWNPLLETPPFPEYTSGHSVISTISATILTFLFGDNFQFTDTTEKFFGLPERSFTSFNSAANEAAISRLYGGIHFRDAVENGQKQGREIGNHIVQKLGELKIN
jgi:hypothetical protein